METDVKASKRVQHEKLVRFVRKAFKKLGVPDADAQVGAEALVAADLRGVDTHGVIRFSLQAWYVKWLAEGSMTACPNIRIVTESASTALIDGDRGMGMVVGRRAMQLAIQKAKETGIGMVGVRNSRHYGMSAYYAMQALAHDMIGIATTNASRQVVPTFGREAKFGTNPICFAVPAARAKAAVTKAMGWRFSWKYSAACSPARSPRSTPIRIHAAIFSARCASTPFGRWRNSNKTWTG
jgi:L-2-hydroxycarboxylate dehydrogenase (NAD+)